MNASKVRLFTQLMWRKKVNLFSHPTGRGVSKIFLFWPGGTGRGGGQEREYLIKTKSDVGKKTVVQQIYETYTWIYVFQSGWQNAVKFTVLCSSVLRCLMKIFNQTPQHWLLPKVFQIQMKKVILCCVWVRVIYHIFVSWFLVHHCILVPYISLYPLSHTQTCTHVIIYIHTIA